MNLKKTNSDILSYSTKFAINLSEFVADPEELRTAEYYIDKYATSRIPSLMNTKTAYSYQSFKEDLQFLSRKMEAVRKTLSIWELYKIKEVAFNKDELEYKLGALPPNSGLVVNFEADELQIGDKTYSQGDIVFSDFLGTQYILKSFSGGFYYPYKFEEIANTTGVYKIYYKYSTMKPQTGNAVLEHDHILEEPVQEISLQMTQANTNDRYNCSRLIEAKKSIRLAALKDTDNAFIHPIVAWFIVDPNDKTTKIDRVYFDIEWSYDSANNQVVFTNPTTLPCWCEVR